MNGVNISEWVIVHKPQTQVTKCGAYCMSIWICSAHDDGCMVDCNIVMVAC